jgi:hypothetical protein
MGKNRSEPQLLSLFSKNIAQSERAERTESWMASIACRDGHDAAWPGVACKTTHRLRVRFRPV